MNFLLLFFGAGVLATVSVPSAETVTFDTAETGKPPAGGLAGPEPLRFVRAIELPRVEGRIDHRVYEVRD